MYNNLKRVYAVTSKRGIDPTYSHMWLNYGTVMATDGSMTLAVEVPELAHLNVVIPADKFIKAIQATSDAVKISATDINIIVRDGKFSARIPFIDVNSFPLVKPSGKLLSCNGIIEALTAVAPFIGSDATHAWSAGVLVTDDYVYATNNVILVRYKVSMDVPNVNIPVKAVNELIRNKKDPVGTVYRDGAITFLFEDDSWLDTALLEASWPDISRMFYNEELINIHPELRSAIEKVSPFCKQPLPRVHFSGDGVRTDEGDTSSVYEGINLPVACFNADVLADVLPSIEKVDWSYYPKPCPFSGCGGKLEGLIMGLRT